MRKQIILARPNLFIIKEMKKLMEDCSFATHRIEKLIEIERFGDSEVNGLVISTGLHSPVGVGYVETIQKVRELFPNKPILLASMIDTENMKKSILLNFAKNGVNSTVLTISEAEGRNSFDNSSELLIVQKSDITDQNLYSKTKAAILKYFA